jgi:hypothetical protein
LITRGSGHFVVIWDVRLNAMEGRMIHHSATAFFEYLQHKIGILLPVLFGMGK